MPAWMVLVWWTPLLLSAAVESFDPMPPPLDPRIPTLPPHVAANGSADSCVGQCAFGLIEQIRSSPTDLLSLDYDRFLRAIANTTFLDGFCKSYHKFEHCASLCPAGYLHEMLMRSAELIDHFCVFEREPIDRLLPCVASVENMDACLRSCTPHREGVASLVRNFRHLALSSDTTAAERYVGESCEFVICTLHCDVPAIAAKCGFDTARLVITLTRRVFRSMQAMSLDSGALGKWPAQCKDIGTYRLPSKPGADTASAIDYPDESEKLPHPSPAVMMMPTPAAQVMAKSGWRAHSSVLIAVLLVPLWIVM